MARTAVFKVKPAVDWDQRATVPEWKVDESLVDLASFLSFISVAYS